MTREQAKEMALSRNCRCVEGKNRDSNYNECIDKVFDYFEKEVDSYEKKLALIGEIASKMLELPIFKESK
jgi:hypothetical protein